MSLVHLSDQEKDENIMAKDQVISLRINKETYWSAKAICALNKTNVSAYITEQLDKLVEKHEDEIQAIKMHLEEKVEASA